jgi:SnoaL-like domain
VSDARAVLRDLVDARNAGSVERVAELLAADVRYWDCERGDLAGRDAVAAALVALKPHVTVETLAAADSDAVLELQAGTTACYRSTEAYRLAGSAVVSVKAYFDPRARSAGSGSAASIR